ncbi:kinase-like domain-containing protein [Nemania sp. FL0031]|nr:kinase-like domain-containing protein [Nemania sp. FL0031]
MFQWYSEAKACYVYLSDVEYTEGEEIDPTSEFGQSKWFTRSWTLQELIAPPLVTFFDISWHRIGTKQTLLDTISVVTGIPQLCLSGEKAPADFSVAARFSWASERTCTRLEDIAYSLMGLFGVNMPIAYGEGRKAFFRLQEEIFKSIDDQSIFSWGVSKEDSRCGKPEGVFAASPADFATAGQIYPFVELEMPPSQFLSRGVSISLPLETPSMDAISSLSKDYGLSDLSRIQVAYLNCGPDSRHATQIYLLHSSPPFSTVQSSPIMFHRLATPLVVVARHRNLEYRHICLNTGLNMILRDRQTTLYYGMTEPASPGSRRTSVPQSPPQDTDVADASFTKGGFGYDETLLDAVVDTLNEGMIYNVTGKLFLPEGTLNEVLDNDTMLRLLQELQQRPNFTSGNIPYVSSRWRKTFAILALSGLLRFFQTMIGKLGITDECLPMPEPEYLPSSTLIIGTGNAQHLEKWESVTRLFGKKVLARVFFEKQWCVLAPVFRNRDQIQHYSLSQHHILPFFRGALGKYGDSTGHAKKSDLKSSSSSEIQKVYIHPDHHDFGTGLDASTLEHEDSFALKTLLRSERKSFEMEKNTLERFQGLSSLAIVQLLASYEMQANDIDRTPITYNLLFHRANGNLSQFWESSRHSQDEYIVPWIAEQCWRLADALNFIHMGYLDFGSDSDKPNHFYGIHGDIRPENILRLPAVSVGEFQSLGRLVIGGFGLTNFYPENTGSITSSSEASSSVTYSTPEFMPGGKISRKADIWALGCVFLDFITWFLKASDSVNHKFPAISQGNGRTPSARSNPIIRDWIQMLYSNDGCSGYFSDLLDLIRSQMLAVSAHDSPQTDEISQTLKQMYLKCLSRPHYYHANSKG